MTEEALRTLYLHYHKRVYAFAFSMLKASDLSDEVVQETFIKLWQSRTRIIPGHDPDAYLFAIAKRIVIDLFRRQTRDAKMRAELWKRTDLLLNVVEEQVEGKELDRVVSRLVRQLPEQQRRVFKLNREKGLSYQEIAEELAISPETVKCHLAMAKKKLTARLKGYGIRFDGGRFHFLLLVTSLLYFFLQSD